MIKIKREKRHRWSRGTSLISLFCSLCLWAATACVPLPPARPWSLSDLRLLDPADRLPKASTDILAVYTRTLGSDQEIRVDFLDLPMDPDYYLQVRLDTKPGGGPWDLIIDIPSSGYPSLSPATSGLVARLVRDPWLDALTLRFNRFILPATFSLQVASFAPGESVPADETIPVRSDAEPPSQRASLLLAFWDVFPAATPAQALRRWDGAHTGPRGERHGLRHILDNASSHGIPVALLDIKNPTSLGALDLVGGLPLIQRMQAQGLLILPDVVSGVPTSPSLTTDLQVSAGFSLPASNFIFNPTYQRSPNSLAQFLPMEDVTHLARSGGTRLIPIPSTEASQITREGLTLEARQALMDAALSFDPSDLIVLGGDLQLSTWGNENMAASAFAWLAAHPWIQVLSEEGLLTFPAQSQDVILPEPSPAGTPLLDALQQAPDNPLTWNARLEYVMLGSPTTSQDLSNLKAVYLNQVAYLLAAAHWAEQPYSLSACDQDLGAGGKRVCVLSSEHVFSILDPLDASLIQLFYVDAAGPHELVGPSSQLAVGLSDPSEWDLSLGNAADPSVIPGGFGDARGSQERYWAESTPSGIIFTSEDGTTRKSYQLLQNGLAVYYRASQPISTRLPLVVDPHQFFQRPMKYMGDKSPQAWTWGPMNGIDVQVRTDAAFSVSSFSDSLPALLLAENPDGQYPAGHYLPFPLSVISFEAEGDFSVQITAK